jgi:type I restriction enzyme S subunit
MLPDGWQKKTVLELGRGRAGTVQTGPFGSQLHSDDYVQDGVPLLLIRNIGPTGLNLSDLPRITHEDAQRLARYSLRPGDVVFSRVGRVGSCFLATEEHSGWIISGQTLRIRVPYEELDPRYFIYALRDKEVQDLVTGASVGTTRTSINTSILENLSVRLPPFRHQSRIADTLATVDRAIEQTEALIGKYQRIKTGLMQDLLTRGIDEHGRLRDPATHKFKPSPLGYVPDEWRVKPLREVANILHGYAFSSQFFSEDDNGVVLLTPGNFHVSGGLYFEPRNTKFYTGRIPQEFILSDDDILVVMTDLTKEMAILGNTVALHYSKRVLHNQRIGRVQVFDLKASVPNYLVLAMNSPFCKSVIKATATGTTVRHTSPDKIRSVLLPFPQPNEQKAIVCIVAFHDNLVGHELAALSKLRRLKTGLMQDLLTGKVSVEPLLRSQTPR